MQIFWSNFLFILMTHLTHIRGYVPDEHNRLNSLQYNDQIPLPSMYLPLNCHTFKQKGIIAWMIHEGMDVPDEDKMLFEKCGNVEKDYIVGETFLFGERNVEKMKRYSRYLRQLLQKKTTERLPYSNCSDNSKGRKNSHKPVVVRINYKELHRSISILSILMLTITVISAVITILAFVNYREYPGMTYKRPD